MNTIAIWYKEKTSNPSQEEKIDIHINLWKLKVNNKPKKSEFLMDFGFMIHDITHIEMLHIHFPFKVEQKNLLDLGGVLHKSKEYVNSVFNENYILTDPAEAPKQKRVQDQGHKTVFTIYALDFTTGDTSLQSCFDGTQLSINLFNIPKNPDNTKYYFRIRINGDCLTNFIKNFEPAHWYFQSAFTSTDTVDFRINEKRNLNKSLEQEITKNKTFAIQKIHFLLMRDAPDDLVADHLNITCRELEPNLWSDYVGSNYNVKNVIAYHWSEKVKGEKPLDSFNTLVKIKYNKSNWKTIWLYILVASLLAFCFNGLYDVIKYLLLK